MINFIHHICQKRSLKVNIRIYCSSTLYAVHVYHYDETVNEIKIFLLVLLIADTFLIFSFSRDITISEQNENEVELNLSILD